MSHTTIRLFVNETYTIIGRRHHGKHLPFPTTFYYTILVTISDMYRKDFHDFLNFIHQLHSNSPPKLKILRRPTICAKNVKFSLNLLSTE